MTRLLSSLRVTAAIALLIAYHGAALAWFARGDGPVDPSAFALWFAGDLVIGLAALALVERR